MRSVTHLEWICQVQLSVPLVVQPPLLRPLTLLNLIHFFVGWFVTSFNTEVEVKSRERARPELFAVTVPRTSGASVVPTFTASANGASATLDVYWLWSSQTTISIRSLAAFLTASIFVHGLHMEPVTSSIIETSMLLPPLLVPMQDVLGQSAAVAVVVRPTQPK